MGLHMNLAIPLYEEFVRYIKEISGTKVFTGVFGADMKIILINDGPFTIYLEVVDEKVL